VNTLQIVRTTGQMETPGRAASLPLQRGDLVWILTGQGGGYGDPRQRDRKAVIDDLKNGYITRAEALGPYGLRDRDIDGVTA
jgi:N-methylhydantoinase B